MSYYITAGLVDSGYFRSIAGSTGIDSPLSSLANYFSLPTNYTGYSYPGFSYFSYTPKFAGTLFSYRPAGSFYSPPWWGPMSFGYYFNFNPFPSYSDPADSPSSFIKPQKSYDTQNNAADEEPLPSPPSLPTTHTMRELTRSTASPVVVAPPAVTPPTATVSPPLPTPEPPAPTRLATAEPRPLPKPSPLAAQPALVTTLTSLRKGIEELVLPTRATPVPQPPPPPPPPPPSPPQSEDDKLAHQLMEGTGVIVNGFNISLNLRPEYRQKIQREIERLQKKHGVSYDDLKTLTNAGQYPQAQVQSLLPKLVAAQGFTKDLFDWLGSKNGFGFQIQEQEKTGWRLDERNETGDVNDSLRKKRGACTEKTSISIAALTLAGVRAAPFLVYDPSFDIGQQLDRPDAYHITAGVAWPGEKNPFYYDANYKSKDRSLPLYQQTVPIDLTKYTGILTANRASTFPLGQKMVTMLQAAEERYPDSELIHLNLALAYSALGAEALRSKKGRKALHYRRRATDHFLVTSRILHLSRPKEDRPREVQKKTELAIKGSEMMHIEGLKGNVQALLQLIKGSPDEKRELTQLEAKVVADFGPDADVLKPVVDRLHVLKDTS